jgi:predicted SAM-dependent methyltransferase
MKVFIRALAFGIASYIPWIAKLKEKGTRGTVSARYCYSVWLRHLVIAHKNGLNTFPHVVAELGPGDSLGMSLSALISGCEKCFAFDIVEHTNIEKNLEVFDELVQLFRSRADIPGDDEFPRVRPKLTDYSFPTNILNDARLTQVLNQDRLDRIRDSIINMKASGSMIEYKAPWYESEVLQKASVDMIFSQAVLEHVDELDTAYKTMHAWLKLDGYMSHTIDFKCHGTAAQWNGHWRYSDWLWRLIRGNRAYILNREPYSTHSMLLKKNDFSIVFEQKVTSKSNFSRDQLARKFRTISNSDLQTSGVFIQAVKQ